MSNSSVWHLPYFSPLVEANKYDSFTKTNCNHFSFNTEI